MMKRLVLFVISVLMACMLGACGQKNEVTDAPSDIEAKIADAIGKDQYLLDTNMDEEKFIQFYDLDKDKIESYVAKENKNPDENPDQLVILKVKGDYSDTAVEKLNKGYEKIVKKVRKSSDGLAKVLNARIYNKDNYVAFFLTGENYDGNNIDKEVKLAKAQYEKIDNTWKELFGEIPSNLIIIPPDK